MSLINVIDTLLPQTQCTKCGYEGCLPYANALAEGDDINKCPPGGDETIHALASLLDKPIIPLAEEAISSKVAFIREAECIGCTKCIQACPVDAIVGAAKLMHTVIATECTGCDLCVVPCPVDCIDMLSLPTELVALTGGSAHTEAQRVARQLRRDHARQRFENHKARLLREEARKQEARQARTLKVEVQEHSINTARAIVEKVKTQKGTGGELTAEQKRLKIELAMLKVAVNKVEKQLKQYESEELKQQLKTLTLKLHTAQQAFDDA